MIIKKAIKIIFVMLGIFLLLILLYAIYNNYRYPVFSSDELILSSNSPNDIKVAKIYFKKNGVTLPNMIMIEVCLNEGNCRIIYYNKEQSGDFINTTNSNDYEINFKWIDNDNVQINNYIINVNKGLYDFRRHENNYNLVNDN